MFENYPISKKIIQEQILADFTEDFFQIKKPENILEFLMTNQEVLHHPPEPFAESLRRKIADVYQLNEQNILVYNGLQDALYHITQLLQTSSCKILLPAAPHFEEVGKYFRLNLDFSDVPHRAGNFRGFKAAFLANPSMPQGQILYLDELEDLCREYPETIFVLDETFIDFCRYTSTAVSLVKKLSNLLIIKPFSSQAGLPGLNLSFVAAHKRIAEALQRNTPARNINAWSIEIGKSLVDHIQNNPLDLTQIHQNSREFMQMLHELENLEVFPSYCHYFMVEIQDTKTSVLKKFLWEQHQILIDDLAGFRGIKENQFRLCTIKPEHNHWLLDILKSKSYLL